MIICRSGVGEKVARQEAAKNGQTDENAPLDPAAVDAVEKKLLASLLVQPFPSSPVDFGSHS
jgi:hypothetical protein